MTSTANHEDDPAKYFKTPVKKYRKIIDEFISRLPTNIKNIYGGITKRDLVKRQNEHIKSSNDFKGMKIIELFTIKLMSERDMLQIVCNENYLINELNNKFGDKCINDKNIDGSPAQRGGAGMDDDITDEYKFYVMYK